VPIYSPSSSSSSSTSSTVFFQSSSELATLTNTFNVDGAATDPTDLTLTVTSPSGVANAYTWPSPSTVTRTGTGSFTKDIPCTEAGEWQYVWVGTGVASDAEAGSWTVFETDLGKLYCTPQQLKSRLGITDTIDDMEVYAACFSASRSIENYCERTFWRTSSTARTFVPYDLYHVRLGEFNDLVSVTSLATDFAGDGTFETSWASTDYQLLPLNPAAAAEPRPYTMVKAVGSLLFPYPNYRYNYNFSIPARFDRVQITGVWGWPEVPWGIRMAAMILAEETLKLKEAPFGVAGFGEFGSVRIRQNPKVKVFAGPYAKHPEDDRGRKMFFA
jgi:hypothetical protein